MIQDICTLYFESISDPSSDFLHAIYQFECPGCKASYVGKTDRCLELRLNEHSDFRTSAVGKHLFQCEHFHHIVNLHNISVYSELEPSFIETHHHISAAISENTKIIDRNNNWTQLCHLESLHIKRLAPFSTSASRQQRNLTFSSRHDYIFGTFDSLLRLNHNVTPCNCFITNSWLVFL